MAGNRKSSILVALLLTFLIPNARAQLAVGYSGSLTSEAGADIDQELKLGTPNQREGLLRILGVDQALAHDAAIAVAETNIRVDQVAGSEAHLLFLPCSGPGIPTSHLYLLRAAKDHHWHVMDTASFDCWREPTSYELIQTQGKAAQSILVHHVNRGHGSGTVEDSLLLFEVEGDHLVKVLETEEYTSKDQMTEGPIVQHSSTVLPFPDGSLEETRITTTLDPPGRGDKDLDASVILKHIALAERRRWYWSEVTKSYVPEQFAAIRP